MPRCCSGPVASTHIFILILNRDANALSLSSVSKARGHAEPISRYRQTLVLRPERGALCQHHDAQKMHINITKAKP